MSRGISLRPNFFVSDLDRAIAFYRDVLGFEVSIYEPTMEFAMLHKDGAALALVVTRRRRGHPDLPKVADAYMEVADLASIYSDCIAAGVPVVVPADSRPWGMTDFVVSDPDGHLIAIGERTETTNLNRNIGAL